MRLAAVVAMAVLTGCGAKAKDPDLIDDRETRRKYLAPGDDPRTLPPEHQPKWAPGDKAPAPDATIESRLNARIAELQREVAELRALLAHVTAGAPEYSDTLAKVAARHSLLLQGIDFQDAVKANWWCSSFACFRSQSLCKAVEERGLKPGDTAEDCLPRRNVFCRGFGLPLMGGAATGAKDGSKVMTCHFSLENCERMVKTFGGDCLGVE